jgi:hypothetical protein
LFVCLLEIAQTKTNEAQSLQSANLSITSSTAKYFRNIISKMQAGNSNASDTTTNKASFSAANPLSGSSTLTLINSNLN